MINAVTRADSSGKASKLGFKDGINVLVSKQ